MTESYLERAMRGVKPRNVAPSFRAHVREQESLPRRILTSSGHLDKQHPCHCRYDQTCERLVCGHCDRMVHHNQIFTREVDEEATAAWEGEPGKVFYMTVGYKRCACGAKQWQYACEARFVQRTN